MDLNKNLPVEKIIFCNRCKQDNNHVCAADHTRNINYSEELWSEFVYRLWICAGCEQGTLETCYCDQNSITDEKRNYTNEYAPYRTYFFHEQKNFIKLPNKLRKIYQETLISYNYQLHILCASGLRSLIEGICKDKKINGNNLFEKIEGLKSLIPENIVNNLHGFRFMGNSALHELDQTASDKLKLAIEICEDLLNFMYELEYKSQGLSKVNK